MHADPAVHVRGAGLGAAENVEVGQAGQRPHSLRGRLQPGKRSLSSVLPPARVFNAFVVAGFWLSRNNFFF